MIALLLQNVLPADDAGSWLGYLKVLFLLALILGLCFVILRYGLPKLQSLQYRRESGPIQMISRFPLEPRRTLYVIRAGAQYLLVASSENGVQFLCELDGEGVKIAESIEAKGAQQ